MLRWTLSILSSLTLVSSLALVAYWLTLGSEPIFYSNSTLVYNQVITKKNSSVVIVRRIGKHRIDCKLQNGAQYLVLPDGSALLLENIKTTLVRDKKDTTKEVDVKLRFTLPNFQLPEGVYLFRSELEHFCNPLYKPKTIVVSNSFLLVDKRNFD